MAPEIKEGRTYSGPKVDIFSLAVVLFVVVQGIFPFKEARPQEFFYNLLMSGKYDLYFSKVNATNLSEEFKDLMIQMTRYSPDLRPDLE